MNTYFAGVDPSIKNTGLVVLSSEGEIVACCNSHDIKEERTAKNNKTRTMLSRASYICSAIDTVPIDADIYIGYENYSFGSTHKAFSLAEFGGILKSFLLSRTKHNFRLFAPTTVKKFATGNAFASKEDMISQALEESEAIKSLGSELTDDICDAYFIAKLVWYIVNMKGAASYESNKRLLRNRLEMSKELLYGNQ